MKLSIHFTPLLLRATAYAATLNVGSGQTYRTVSSNKTQISPYSRPKNNNNRLPQHTMSLLQVIPSTSTPGPTKRN